MQAVSPVREERERELGVIFHLALQSKDNGVCIVRFSLCLEPFLVVVL